jgi:hypothetical protein
MLEYFARKLLLSADSVQLLKLREFLKLCRGSERNCMLGGGGLELVAKIIVSNTADFVRIRRN